MDFIHIYDDIVREPRVWVLLLFIRNIGGNMYQYINAAISGITGLKDVVDGTLCNTGISKKVVNIRSYLSIVFLGLGLTISLLLLTLSFELVLFSLPQGASLCVAFISLLAALFIAGMLIKHEMMHRLSRTIKQNNVSLLNEKTALEQKINDLVTHSDIASAAASSKSFGCFMGSVARLLRRDNTARELTIFTNSDGIILPHTYYQLSEFSELCLSFSGNNLKQVVQNLNKSNIMDSELFDAQNLVLEYVDGNITINGGLTYKEISLGGLRVTLFECSEKSHTFKELVEGIVQNALSSVYIEFENIEEAMYYKQPVLTCATQQMKYLMVQLVSDEDILGVVKLGFSGNSLDFVERQKSILSTVSAHISKALYSQSIYELAIKDGLTNLYNKRYLIEALQKDYESVLLGEDRLSFALIDIDYFKKVNDTWGHLMGDEVLKRVAEIVSSSARESDIVCRYGGEELAILMPSTSIVGAEALAERIRTSIEDEVFITSEGGKFGITASFGVAGFGREMISPNELVDEADKALYLAKNNGRNRVVVSGRLTLIEGIEGAA